MVPLRAGKPNKHANPVKGDLEDFEEIRGVSIEVTA
jgi:hypothetical protein